MEWRKVTPLPPNATNADLIPGLIYDTGKRKVADFFDIAAYQKYPNAEQMQIRLVAVDQKANLEDLWKWGHDAWSRQPDGAIVLQCWDITEVARRSQNAAWMHEQTITCPSC